MSLTRAAANQLPLGAEPATHDDSHLASTESQESFPRTETGSIAVPPGFVRPLPQLVRSRRHVPVIHGANRARKRLDRRSDFGRMRTLLWAADALIAATGAIAALWVADRSFLIIPLAWLFMTAVRASRDGRVADLNDLAPFIQSSIKYVSITTLAGIVVTGSISQIREVLAISAGLAVLGYLARRLIGRPATRRALSLSVGESVVIVGDLASVSRTITEWQGLELVNVVGVCLSESDFGPKEVKGVPVLGSAAEVASLSQSKHIDVVAVHDVDKLGGLQLARLQWALEDAGTQLSVITPITNTIVERARVRKVGRRVMVDVAYSRPQGVVAFAKGLIDRVLAVMLVIISAPLMAACAIAIAVNSPGPVLFKQTRVREHGQQFTMYKLRTMTVDAEERLSELEDLNEVGGGLFKIRNDPRITGVGKWLRRLSLDELPQLWNVVVGDMSLIGPRPALPREVESYDELARRRLAVKPGLTGLWQVSGRSNLSWDESVRIDSDYVDNWSPGREVAIALRTVKAVLSKDGAH